jgi:electron transport complex protein RnfC
MIESIKKAFNFRGGVHPPEYKKIAADKPITQGPVPAEIAVLLRQHIGAPPKTIVEKNDELIEGQTLAEAGGFVSAPVHSPVKGKLKNIALKSNPIHQRAQAFIIAPDPDNPQRIPAPEKFDAAIDISNYKDIDIEQAVSDAGIVGMGGAGFPTHVKIHPDPENKRKHLIINACECEPYITCDYRLMLEWTDQVILGVRLAKKACDAPQATIAIEDNKPQAIKTIADALKKLPADENISVTALKTKYPQGGERQLIKAVLNQQVPTGKIPPMIGIVVLNVATVAAIADAVILKNPLTHRVVTVTGQSVINPGNYYCAIGTSVRQILDHVQLNSENAVRVLLGGPMMGLAITDMQTPITKTTNAITVLSEKEIGKNKFNQKTTPCIRCGRCLDACPEGLNPTKIAHAVKVNDIDTAKDFFMSACIECGCCSYVCPANINLTGYIKIGKAIANKQKQK